MVGFKATDVPPTATVKFLGAGTAACIADLITFPLDTAKVRLQIQGESQGLVRTSASAQYRGVLGTILTMVRTEGPRSLYNGLVAGLQRQMSFASVRIGLYDSVKQFYTKGSEREYEWSQFAQLNSSFRLPKSPRWRSGSDPGSCYPSTRAGAHDLPHNHHGSRWPPGSERLREQAKGTRERKRPQPLAPTASTFISICPPWRGGG